MSNMLVKSMEYDYKQYLSDESRSQGEAGSISFPVCEDDILQVLPFINEENIPLTVQGARTGITAGAVPHGGHVLNLSRMNRITGLRYDNTGKCFILTVQPNVLLSQVRKALLDMNFDTEGWSSESINALKLLSEGNKWFFTPDPTETSASIGGMVACNASGARSFYYGPTRNYIQGLRVILTDGSALTLKRGEHKAQGRLFTLKTDSGKIISGELPDYFMPNVKNASGYYIKENMDLIDLFIGSEGTLGIITEIEISLMPMPAAIWGVTVFFPDETSAINFVEAVRQSKLISRPAAIEYFNNRALNLLRKQKEQNAAFGQIQEILPEYHTAIYVEYHGESVEELGNLVMKLGELITECGGDEKNTWLASNPIDLDKLLLFRHATPESVNMLIDERRKNDPNITKLGTDMAVPDHELKRIVEIYNSSLLEVGVESVMFGHIGNNHIHVNILPRDMDDYKKGKSLYLNWARQVIKMGGTVSAEHGVGKLKTPMLLEMYGEEGIEKMKKIKRYFDPKGILNPGNMFSLA